MTTHKSPVAHKTQVASSVPNAINKQRAARQVAERLAQVQEQRMELEGFQIANDHNDADGIPGLPKYGKNGNMVVENNAVVLVTYGERYAEIDAAEMRVVKWGESLNVMRLVGALIEAENAEAEVNEPDA